MEAQRRVLDSPSHWWQRVHHQQHALPARDAAEMVETSSKALGVAYRVLEPHWCVGIYAVRCVGHGVWEYGGAVSGWVGDILVSTCCVSYRWGDANVCLRLGARGLS